MVASVPRVPGLRVALPAAGMHARATCWACSQSQHASQHACSAAGGRPPTAATVPRQEPSACCCEASLCRRACGTAATLLHHACVNACPSTHALLLFSAGCWCGTAETGTVKGAAPHWCRRVALRLGCTCTVLISKALHQMCRGVNRNCV